MTHRKEDDAIIGLLIHWMLVCCVSCIKFSKLLDIDGRLKLGDYYLLKLTLLNLNRLI